MAILPRPVSPRSAFADLMLMFSADRPHRWGLLGVATALTGLMVWGFYLESIPPKPERQIIYVQNWVSSRKDSEIIRQQKIDLANYEAALAKKQKEFQRVADIVGIEWREDEARNTAQRQATVVQMQALLDKKLAAALAREAAEDAAANTPEDRAGAKTERAETAAAPTQTPIATQ